MTIFYELHPNLYLNLTNKCTNSCAFCIRDYDDGSYTKANLWIEKEPTISDIIEDSKRFDIKSYPEIVVCGYGEPLIKLSEAIGAIKYLKENFGSKIRINTNGLASHYHGKNVPKMLYGLCDVISISLNQKDAVSYNELCRPYCGEQAFDAILEFASEAKKYIPRVIFTAVDVISEEDISACREIATKMGIEFRLREKI